MGSVGTLAFMAEVVLRCHPCPEVEAWWRSDPGSQVDPFRLHASLYRPLSILWDGRSVWVGLAGHRADVAEQARAGLGASGAFTAAAGPPPMPAAGRRSLPAAALQDLPQVAGVGGWVAEVGVGVVHCDETVVAALPVLAAATGVVELHRRIKGRFDPSGRLNPGRSPLAVQAVAAR